MTELPPPRRRILAAIDFSPASVGVVAAAVSLARDSAGAIEVLFVLPSGAPSRTRGRRTPAVDPVVTGDVEGLLEPARAAGIPVRVCLRVGRPAGEILDEIRHAVPDVALLATHSYGGSRRHTLGSVAAEVLREAPCAVVTIAQETRTGPQRLQFLRGRVAAARA
jgi:nucleotide-binding universal stress UspA family protein